MTSTAADARAPRIAPLTLGGRLRGLACLLAGALVGLGFDPTALWPLVIVGLGAATLLLAGRTRRGAFGYGYLFGLGLCGVSISWLYTLSWWIGLLLVAFIALFLGLYGLLVRAALRLPGWPVWAACCWMLIEFLWCRFPFGGFGWIRLGYPAVHAPLAGLLPWVGVVGTGFVLALLAQALAWAVRGSAFERGTLRWAAFAVALLLAVSGGVAGRALGPKRDHPAARTITVGWVQGNIEWRGMEMGRARVVTNNHLSETVTLAAKARAGVVRQPDFVLWPENSTDVDPLLDPEARATIQQAVATTGTPILVGAVLAGPEPDTRQTAGLWWDRDGVRARYEKRNLVPFGEFIPGRDVLLPMFPILQLTGEQSIPGTRPGALDVGLADGRRLVVGDVICFELAWDATVYDTVRHGAQVIMVQSNNASYGGSPQIGQQWTMTRARALETGRDVVVATTDSYSGVIRADGTVEYRSREFVSDSGVTTLPLRDGLTLAVRLAPLLDWGFALAGLGALVAGTLLPRLRRRAAA